MGKGAFASRAARFLVTHGRGGDGQPVPLDDPGDAAAGRLVAAGNHPEILTLERLPKDKGKDLARNITIDQVRGMIRRLHLSLSLGHWRVCRSEEHTSDLQSLKRIMSDDFCWTQ